MKANQLALYISIFCLAIHIAIRILTSDWNYWVLLTALVFCLVSNFLTKKELAKIKKEKHIDDTIRSSKYIGKSYIRLLTYDTCILAPTKEIDTKLRKRFKELNIPNIGYNNFDIWDKFKENTCYFPTWQGYANIRQVITVNNYKVITIDQLKDFDNETN